MKILLDANILIEILLDQQRAREAKDFLLRFREHEFHVTDFAIHSIGIILFRRRQGEIFNKLLDELQRIARIISLSPSDLKEILDITSRQHLDFDDGYQYAVAVRHDLTIVSFDGHFDSTERGRRTPDQILR